MQKKNLEEALDSFQLEPGFQIGKYQHAVAIMWGEERQGGEANQRIDLFLWEYQQPDENAEISTLQFREGVIVGPREDYTMPVSCEGGFEIARAEARYRREYSVGNLWTLGPSFERMSGIQLLFPKNDFCSVTGRKILKGIVESGEYLIDF